MYTRCPKCSTCFRVTDRHLAIANGKVRCGQCQLVFNAPENAIEDLPSHQTPSTAVTPTAKSKTLLAPTQAEKDRLAKAEAQKNKIGNAAKPAEVKKQTTPIIEKTNVAAPAFNADATMIADINALNKDDVTNIDLDTPHSSAATRLASNDNDDDVFNNDFDLDAAINELNQATEDSYKYDNKKDAGIDVKKEPAKKNVGQVIPTGTRSDDVFTTDAYATTSASSVADILHEMEGQLSLNIADPNDADKYDAENEFDFIELDGETDNSAKEINETNDETLKKHFDISEFGFDEMLDNEPDADDEFMVDLPDSESIKKETIEEDELFDQIDLSDFQDSDIQPDIVIEDNDLENVGQHSDENKVPFQLRNDIASLQVPSQRRLHPVLKFSFILILLALSFSQLAYFRAYELVNLVPATRPLLEQFCEQVACLYSGPRDTKQIQLLSRDVRLHPKEKNALLISAAMINNANFAQPYPDIHIRLSDISGNIVAERIFNPKTYMGKMSNPFLLMKSKTPVHINFEVVDPGKDAVNFEFTFL